MSCATGEKTEMGCLNDFPETTEGVSVEDGYRPQEILTSRPVWPYLQSSFFVIICTAWKKWTPRSPVEITGLLCKVLYFSLPELVLPDPQFGAKFLRDILLERVYCL